VLKAEAGESGKCKERFCNKTLLTKFISYRHFCHYFHIPLQQRDARVKEEVAVAVLLSPQPARGGWASRKKRRTLFHGSALS
jgi:hypothetical protein